MVRKKTIAFCEIILSTLAIFAFSFLMGQALPEASASSYLSTGCCLESKSGAQCLDMLKSDEGLCSKALVATQCSEVESCQKGCCYDNQSGSCTLNAPKSPCTNNGGLWINSPLCTIDQCNLGCCILGSQAVSSTSRECTKLSAEYGFEKEFTAMDTTGTCQDYANLNKKGACVVDTGDYSGEKDCVFVEKGECNGEFHSGKLCTAPELGTLCVPKKETTCIEGKDEVYYKDSCGNQANVYDALKYNDVLYWTDVIEPKNLCEGNAKDCGNCDYTTGSICTASNVTDIKPTYGDYICKDLNCDNGKNHGESWCVYDYDVTTSIAPVGTRHFVATCSEGEIGLEGCADYNQEICIQTTSESSGNTYAKCYTNDWRSCINANGAGDYYNVKDECDRLTQCQMFNDYWGTDSVKRSDGEFLAGFNPDLLNSEQGAAGSVGEDANKVIPFCIPKYTPGFQFWNEESTSTTDLSSGGSSTETDYLCSIASFSCISRMTNKCTLAGGCDGWKDKENWECNVDGKTQTIKTKDLPQWMASMNERCRALGSCGTNIGVANNWGFDEGFELTRIKIDRTGKTKTDRDVTSYTLSQTYLDWIKKVSGLKVLGTLEEIPAGNGLDIDSGGEVSESVTGGIIDAKTITAQASDIYSDNGNIGNVATLAGSLGALGIAKITVAGAFTAVAYTVSAAGVGAYVGYQIGKLIADNQGWSPGKSGAFINFMTGVGATAGAAVGIYLSSTATTAGAAAGAAPATMGTVAPAVGVPVVGWVVLIAAAIYMIYSAFFDDYTDTQYYILQFDCQGWEPSGGGDCNACNEDARDCSEYRCRAIGSNCRYYTELGEPGTCASISDTWQAIIKPWDKVLTEGNSYANVGNNGFEIYGSENENEVKSWETLTFGVTTDKDAICKIDTVHTDDYTSMTYEMTRYNETSHYVSLSQFGEQGSILMTEGENELYIRCMNFAGEINEAEFAVQFVLSDEPDLTPPILRRYDPANNGYLKYGTNSTQLTVYLSEPSECKMNNGYDSEFSKMEQNMTCITNPLLGYKGEWPCLATLTGLVNKDNSFYIKCLDKPGENSSQTQRMLSQTYIYNIQKCSEGLNINSITPQNAEIKTNNQGDIILEVQTTGCVNNGEAYCYYNFGGGNIAFLETNSTTHRQVFNSLGSGNYSIGVYCEDSAGNNATASSNLTVIVDQSPPVIARVYTQNNKIYIRTNEPARCAVTTNKTTEACDLQIDAIPTFKTLNTYAVLPISKYYLQCEDEFGNKNTLCQEVYIFN